MIIDYKETYINEDKIIFYWQNGTTAIYLMKQIYERYEGNEGTRSEEKTYTHIYWEIANCLMLRHTKKETTFSNGGRSISY